MFAEAIRFLLVTGGVFLMFLAVVCLWRLGLAEKNYGINPPTVVLVSYLLGVAYGLWLARLIFMVLRYHQIEWPWLPFGAYGVAFGWVAARIAIVASRWFCEWVDEGN